jgi:hypothetical protein
MALVAAPGCLGHAALIANMGKDPLFRESQQETERLAADRKVMTFATVIMFLKMLTGFLALALIAAIWFVWRAG